MNIDFLSFDKLHHLGEIATGAIAHFSGSLALLFLVVEVQSTSSSPLQGAYSLASEYRSAGTQHVARNPCYTLARKPEKRTL
jgi:hypothetical protein